MPSRSLLPFSFYLWTLSFILVSWFLVPGPWFLFLGSRLTFYFLLDFVLCPLNFVLYPLSFHPVSCLLIPVSWFSYLKTCQGQHWESTTPRGIAGLRIINPFAITFAFFLLPLDFVLYPCLLVPGSWFLVPVSWFKVQFLLFTFYFLLFPFSFLLDFVLCPFILSPGSCLSQYSILSTQYW